MNQPIPTAMPAVQIMPPVDSSTHHHKLNGGGGGGGGGDDGDNNEDVVDTIDGPQPEAVVTDDRQSEAPFLVLARSRILATAERGGLFARVLLHVLPFWIDMVWVIIYFTERNQDVFIKHGPCVPPYNGTASPFFITARDPSQWSSQVAFAIITQFVFMPFRLLRDRVPSNPISFACEITIDIITVLPFLVSVLILPLYQLYVPTFLRAWTARVELHLLIGDHSLLSRTVLFLVKLVCLCITMMGLFEWSQNNFPVQNLVFSDVHNDVTLSYPCVTFTESLYFFVVTFATVGYGDIVPTNDFSRVIVTLCIFVFLILLPAMIQQLTSLVESARDQTLMRYTAGKNHQHVVISGALSPSTVREWMVCTPSSYWATLIFVSPDDMDPAFERIVHSYSQGSQVLFLKSRLHSKRELERCGIDGAGAHVILPGTVPALSSVTRAENVIEQDRDGLSRLWASQSFFPKTPLRVVLHSHVNLPSSNNGQENDNLVTLPLDYWTQRVAAANVALQGLSTIISFFCFGGSGDANQSHAEAEESWEGDWEDDVDEMERRNEKDQSATFGGSRSSFWGSMTHFKKNSGGGGKEQLLERGGGGGGTGSGEMYDGKPMHRQDEWLWTADMVYLDSMRKSVRRVPLDGLDHISLKLSVLCRFFSRSSVLVLGAIVRNDEVVLDGDTIIRQGHDLIVFATPRGVHLVKSFVAWNEVAMAESRRVSRMGPRVDRGSSGADHDDDDPVVRRHGTVEVVATKTTPTPHRQWPSQIFFSPIEQQPLMNHVIVIPSKGTVEKEGFFAWFYVIERLAEDMLSSPQQHAFYPILIVLPHDTPPNETDWNHLVELWSTTHLAAALDSIFFTTGCGFKPTDLLRIGLTKARSILVLGDYAMCEGSEEKATALDRDFYIVSTFRAISSLIATENIQHLQVFISFCMLETITYFSDVMTKRSVIGNTFTSHKEHPVFKYAPTFIVNSLLLSINKQFTTTDTTSLSQRGIKLSRVSKLYPKIVNGCNHPLFADSTFWSPEILNIMLVASVFKGSWLPAFLRRVLEIAGKDLVLLRVHPEWIHPMLLSNGDGIVYGDLCRMCNDNRSNLSHFNIWGVFKNFTVDPSASEQFRGVILSPHRWFKFSLAHDRLIVCKL